MQPETAEATLPPPRIPPGLPWAPWTAWGPWTALLATVLIAVAGMVGANILLKVGLVAPADVRRGDSIGLQILMAWQVIVILLTLLLALRGGRPVAALALAPPERGRAAYLGAMGLMLAFQVTVTSLEYLFIPEAMLRDLKPFLEVARGPAWWIALIAVGIGAPLSEELLFRGFLLPALARSRLGFAGAALVSSALWTTLHVGYTVVGLLEVFAVGLLFSWLLWRTGSLRVTILCHAVYNSLIILGLRFAPLPAGFAG